MDPHEEQFGHPAFVFINKDMEKAVRRSFSDITNVVLIVAAVTVVGLLVRREFFLNRAGEPESFEPTQLVGWESLLDTGRVVGPPNATVKIVEFFDYQCPACRYLHRGVKSLQNEFPDDVAVVYRHFPLSSHPQAMPAALAAECAADQDAFSRYSDFLFYEQSTLGDSTWMELATEAGVQDLETFQGCVESGTHVDNIERDLAVGRHHGIRAIPAIIIDGMLYTGLSHEALRNLVIEKMEEKD